MERQHYDGKLRLILRAAAAEFAARGYHDTSIRDISRATGVSLSGLYYYFRGKEELLFLIQDHCFGTVLDNLERVLATERDPRTQLRLMIENHLRFFAANMAEMKVLSHEGETLSGEYRRQVNGRKRRYTDICTGILERIEPHSRVPARTATFSLFGMLNWIYNWYDPERDADVAELAAQMTGLFLQGYARRTEDASADAPRMKVLRQDGAPSIWRTGTE